jgi:glycosyltransferase involved in cell wall biosynthesis
VKKPKPLVSIVVNCHNGEKYLKNCINSVFNQSYKNWEIIFWNNYSSDNSLEIIKNFKNKKIKKFYSKKLIKLYKARNLAIQKAKGKFITFLDVDDYWKKNKLQSQIDIINKSNGKIKMVYSNYYVKNDIKNYIKIQYTKKLPSGKITQELLNNYDVGILSVLIEKSAFKEKKFNTNYDIIGDYDFFINFSLKNKIAVSQKPLVVYRLHGNNLSTKKISLYESELKHWLNKSINSKKFRNYSLKSVKFLLLKLRIKNLLNFVLKFLGV